MFSRECRDAARAGLDYTPQHMTHLYVWRASRIGKMYTIFGYIFCFRSLQFHMSNVNKARIGDKVTDVGVGVDTTW